MNALRSAFCTGAALAMLAGCGGGSSPLSPSPAGVAAERTHVRPAYSVLYSFKRGNDGGDPHAGLIKVNGTLYGTTEYGGGPCHARCLGGTVFAITTSGAEAVLHSFIDGSGDGKDPRAGPVDAEQFSRLQTPVRRPCSTASAARGTANSRMRASSM